MCQSCVVVVDMIDGYFNCWLLTFFFIVNRSDLVFMFSFVLTLPVISLILFFDKIIYVVAFVLLIVFVVTNNYFYCFFLFQLLLISSFFLCLCCYKIYFLSFRPSFYCVNFQLKIPKWAYIYCYSKSISGIPYR